ncbi:hypothetical protein BDV12DRAFT_150321 [Aspergillus spectabilis]
MILSAPFPQSILEPINLMSKAGIHPTSDGHRSPRDSPMRYAWFWSPALPSLETAASPNPPARDDSGTQRAESASSTGTGKMGWETRPSENLDPCYTNR